MPSQIDVIQGIHSDRSYAAQCPAPVIIAIEHVKARSMDAKWDLNLANGKCMNEICGGRSRWRLRVPSSQHMYTHTQPRVQTHFSLFSPRYFLTCNIVYNVVQSKFYDGAHMCEHCFALLLFCLVCVCVCVRVCFPFVLQLLSSTPKRPRRDFKCVRCAAVDAVLFLNECIRERSP